VTAVTIADAVVIVVIVVAVTTIRNWCILGPCPDRPDAPDER
jgi:hypothetical protein